MAGVTDVFVALVRKIVGLPEAVGDPPDLMRLGLYPARVDSCASDGSKCDVTPADSRISPEKNVEVLVGIPGSTAVVEPGAVVLLGWRRGDPSAPFCMPAWALGATVDKLVLSANAVEIAGNAYSLPQWDTFIADFNTFITDLANDLTAGSAGGCTVTSTTFMHGKLASTLYKSTKVKNG